MPRPLEQADEYILAAFMAGDLPHSLRQEIIAYIASSDEARDLLAMAQVAMDAAASGDGASKALAVPSILTPLFIPGEENVPSALMSAQQVKELPDPLSIIPVTEGLAPTFEGSYDVVRRAHGYYVLPYFPETYISRSVQAADLETTLARARREGAWIASTSEVLTWWRRRDQVRPVIAAIGRDEMHLDLINDSETPLSGLVMEIRGREGQYKSMRISGGEG